MLTINNTNSTRFLYKNILKSLQNSEVKEEIGMKGGAVNEYQCISDNK